MILGSLEIVVESKADLDKLLEWYGKPGSLWASTCDKNPALDRAAAQKNGLKNDSGFWDSRLASSAGGVPLPTNDEPPPYARHLLRDGKIACDTSAVDSVFSSVQGPLTKDPSRVTCPACRQAAGIAEPPKVESMLPPVQGKNSAEAV